MENEPVAPVIKMLVLIEGDMGSRGALIGTCQGFHRTARTVGLITRVDLRSEGARLQSFQSNGAVEMEACTILIVS